jgi:opacity protein-like surface antigen
MKRLLLAATMLTALASGANANVVNLVTNPNSSTGNFSLTPGAAAFNDQVVFGLSGGPHFLTIANATNTYAGPGDAIQNWVASIWSAGVDQILNAADANPLNDDDVLLFGPQAATACPLVSNCQGVGGSGIINGAGLYYANFTGTGSGTSGYSGNISTFAVPGPALGALIPSLLAGFGLFGFNYLRRRRSA